MGKDVLFFVKENRYVYTIDDLMNFYSYDDGGHDTFKDYLNDCLSGNGSLEVFNPDTMVIENNMVVFKDELLDRRIDETSGKVADMLCKYGFSDDDYYTTWCNVGELIYQKDIGNLVSDLGMIAYKDTSEDEIGKAENLIEELENLISELE